MPGEQEAILIDGGDTGGNQGNIALPDIVGSSADGEELPDVLPGGSSSMPQRIPAPAFARIMASGGGKKAGAAGAKKAATGKKGGGKGTGTKRIPGGRKAALLAEAGGDPNAAKWAADVTRVATATATKAVKAAAADRGAEGQLSAVPQTAEIASLTRRLMALEKPDLVHIITRGVYFGERLSYSSLVKDLPKPSMNGPTTELQRALNAVFRAVPNSRYGSTGDHYCFKRCKSPLDEFDRIISTQISNIINQEVNDLNKNMKFWDLAILRVASCW